MTLLSVIIPVYNSQKYLKECLESVVNQSYKNLEIICINDGSIDSSLDILKDYAAKDSRMKILSQENKGSGSARNEGLKIASGDYIAFIDDDDYIDLDFYEEALKYIDDVDIVIYGIQVFGDMAIGDINSDSEYYRVKHKGKVILQDKLIFNIDVSPCNKLFKKDIIDKFDIDFPEGIYYEDAEFFFKYILCCKSAYFIDKYPYHYRRRKNSIMHQTFSGSEHAIDHLYVVKNLYEFFIKHDIYKDYEGLFLEVFESYFKFSFNHSLDKDRLKVLKLASSYAKMFYPSDSVSSRFIKALKNEKYEKVLSGNTLGLKAKLKAKIKSVLIKRLKPRLEAFVDSKIDIKQISLEEKIASLESKLAFLDKKVYYTALVPSMTNNLLESKKLLKRPLKLTIIIYHKEHFSMHSLCKALKLKGFELSILISPALEIMECLREKVLEDNYNFFVSLGFNTIKGYDFKTQTAYDLESNLPDLIIYQTHWMNDILDSFDVKHFYNKALCLSIPYGFMLCAIEEYTFNEEFHNLVWLNCAETNEAKLLSQRYADNNGINVLVTGYPKMDALLNPPPFKWKNETAKKLIWAPHHSINTTWAINFATFHLYYKDFYEYVKANKDIEVVLRPHPLLKSRVLELNILSEKEYDNYMASFNSLPNGQVYTGANYFGLFASSDALILDSGSFLAEYMYTKKPLCFINRWEDKATLKTRFNNFGKLVLEECYIAKDFSSIKDFIKTVVISQDDVMKNNREKFFDMYFKNYYGASGELIAEYITKALGR
ncbi:glycosyltransferase [Helicobacter sp. 11S02629-2]|uniref:bifunctional glycosyltransferase/CDP-glycerol:glycerophosphate glycerophosphotransferase n=1 Tax=Helicobacter sp. 11S02629-2 TaxID=1476195 RepID=UPI000BA72727|nr:glycosyltransferase [Helicobacter sp. 11S02629-2]PAF45322.1 hypothetical protein BKH40_03790 [Helicobacter sp. 11S02629-2]